MVRNSGKIEKFINIIGKNRNFHIVSIDTAIVRNFHGFAVVLFLEALVTLGRK